MQLKVLDRPFFKGNKEKVNTIRIIYLVHLPPPIHGVSIFNKNVTESSRINRGIETRIIRISFNKNIENVDKISFYKLLKYISLFFEIVISLIRYKPDKIYYSIPPTGSGLYKDIPIVAIMKLFKVNIIYHLHGKGIADEIKKSNIAYRIHQWVYSNSTVIHLSKTLMKNEIIPLNLKNSKLEIVNNGIPYSVEKKTSNEFSETTQILFLSNLWESKGILNALRIFGELRRQNHNILLNIVGDFMDDNTKASSKNIIKNLCIKNHIKFHGEKYDHEKDKIIAENDVLLYPSLNDAYPLVILECMRFGLAIFASDQGGIPDIVNNKFGGIFKTGDDKMAENLLNNYLNLNTENKLKMASYAKETFEEKYRFKRVENDITRILNN
jgi:glycosyltransferase involved in cell wall biosynthesis